METYSAAIILSSEGQVRHIEAEIDKIFSGYSFYPEADWDIFKCKPPDGYQVLGAWRHTNINSYAFLLTNPARQYSPNMQIIIYIQSEQNEISKLVAKLDKLKSKFLFKDVFLDERIERIHKLRAPAFLITILGIFTGLINAFSLYLMKIPVPKIDNSIIVNIYNFLISLFHVFSILFLINFTIIAIIFLLKYALLLLRKV